MDKTLFDYLDKNYELDDSNIVHIHFGGKDYGKNIAREMSLIFSIDFSVIEIVVKQWIASKVKPLDAIEQLWDKYNHHKYYEPKRPNRFVLKFPDDFEIPEYFISTSNRPSATLNNGRIEWQDIEVVLRDPIGPSMTERIHELFLRVGSAYTNREFEYRIQMLGPVGDLVEEWFINGFVTQIDFGQLDYSSDEMMGIKLTIKPTSCVLNF